MVSFIQFKPLASVPHFFGHSLSPNPPFKRNFDNINPIQLAHFLSNHTFRRSSQLSFDDGYKSLLDNQNLTTISTLSLTPIASISPSICSVGFWRDSIRSRLDSRLSRVSKTYSKSKNFPPDKVYDDSNSLLPTYRPSDSSLYLSSCELQLLSKHYLLANHSFYHCRFSCMSDSQILKDFELSHQYFESLRLPILDIFVVPFGSSSSYDQRLIYACSLFGYKSMYVTHKVEPKQHDFAQSLGINMISREPLLNISTL